MRLIDLSGKRFSRLRVIRRAPGVSAKPVWECVCDCGNSVSVRGASLVRGATRSCGCYYAETRVRGTHLHVTHLRSYRIWAGMKSRCLNPRSGSYAWYGARGITVCDRWRESFAAFLSDMGEAPIGRSLDRIDNHGPYAPWNCRWATPLEQANNTRKVLRIRSGNEVLSASELARRIGISIPAMYSRINRAKAVAIADANERLGFVGVHA